MILTQSLPYLSLEHIESNTGRILISTETTREDSGRSNTFAFDNRHVLYGKLRPYLNKVALPQSPGRCTTEAIPLLPIGNDREFVAWFLRREETVAHAMKGKTGSRMPRADVKDLLRLEMPLPPLSEQKRIAAILNEQMAAVAKANMAALESLEAAKALQEVYIRESLKDSITNNMKLGDCLDEIKNGVGVGWDNYQLYGATVDGLAPAKDPVGKNPHRYKLLEPGAVFYNPMRIMIGSIAVVEEDEPSGITSPDYVAVKAKVGVLDWRWFYYWMRSPYGKLMVQATSRGAVRERILFNRLKEAEVEVPSWESQLKASEKLRYLRQLIEVSTKILPDIYALQSPLLRKAFSGEL